MKVKSHVGKILLDEFITPRGSSFRELALKSTISYETLLEIVAGRRKISPIIAKRLSSVYPVPFEYWLNLQESSKEN